MLVKDACYLKSELNENLATEHCHIKLVNPLVHLAIKTLSFSCCLFLILKKYMFEKLIYLIEFFKLKYIIQFLKKHQSRYFLS